MEKNLENKTADLRALNEFYRVYLLGHNEWRDECMKEDMFKILNLVARI